MGYRERVQVGTPGFGFSHPQAVRVACSLRSGERRLGNDSSPVMLRGDGQGLGPGFHMERAGRASVIATTQHPLARQLVLKLGWEAGLKA